MIKRTRLTAGDVLPLMRLLADVAALKSDPPRQRKVLIDGLNELVGTQSSFFYVADAWRTGKPAHFSHATLCSDCDPAFLRYSSEFGIRFPLDADPFCYRSMRDPSPRQTITFDQALPGRADRRRHADFLELKSSTGFCDGLISYYRCGADGDRIVGVGMHRFGKGRSITPRQVALATLAVNELRSLAERGHLVLPDAGDPAPLPQRLRQVLDDLLKGKTPKTIARSRGLSIWTVREHIARLYRRYGVSGREELMARFVGTDAPQG